MIRHLVSIPLCVIQKGLPWALESIYNMKWCGEIDWVSRIDEFGNSTTRLQVDLRKLIAYLHVRGHVEEIVKVGQLVRKHQKELDDSAFSRLSVGRRKPLRRSKVLPSRRNGSVK